MHARSLLLSVKAVDERATALISKPRLSHTPEVPAWITHAMDTFVDLSSLLVAAAPFATVPGREPQRLIESAVRSTLEAVYEHRVIDVENIEPEARNLLLESDRGTVVGSLVVIPLDVTERGTENWLSVIEYLDPKLEYLSQNARRIAERLKAINVDENLRRGAEIVVAMIDRFRDTLRRARSGRRNVGQYVTPRTDGPNQFARWLVDRTGSFENA